MMKIEKIPYREGDTELEGHFVYDEAVTGKRPLVLVAHAWAGQSDFERNSAEEAAKLGYAGFAMDVYGKGVLGKSVDENAKLMQPLVDDRALLLRRLLAGLEAARALPQVDSNRMAAIGFCFGGLAVLDMARNCPDLTGAVSFHGFLNAAEGAKTAPISAKILVLHGHEDSMVPPEQVTGFTKEMTEAGADWQIHIYGKAMHAFTNPEVNAPEMGAMYSEVAARRSKMTMNNFLAEIFAA